MRLPNDIIFLMGAPASGKGTNTPAIMAARGITNPPIVISRLLQEPETKKLMDRGEMVADGIVLEFFLRALLQSNTNVGVLVVSILRSFSRTCMHACVLVCVLRWGWGWKHFSLTRWLIGRLSQDGGASGVPETALRQDARAPDKIL